MDHGQDRVNAPQHTWSPEVPKNHHLPTGLHTQLEHSQAKPPDNSSLLIVGISFSQIENLSPSSPLILYTNRYNPHLVYAMEIPADPMACMAFFPTIP